MRHPRLALALGCLLVVVGSSLALDPAHAGSTTTIDDSGWWWKLQQNPDVPLPGPPTVSEGQLLVQGAAEADADQGAIAIAAIAATLPDGRANPVLTLNVAENGDTGGDSAVLLACQAGSAWEGADAGAWANKPNAACTASAVVGARSEDKATWVFDLAALQFTDKVNVVIVPAEGSTFSLTFEKPASTDITSSEGAPPLPPVASFDPGGDASGSFGPPVDTGGSFTPPPSDGGIALPPVQPALPEEDQTLTPIAPSTQAQNPPLAASTTRTDPRSPHARSVGLVLLLLGGAAVYWATRRQSVPIGPEGIPAGLGRWTQPRWGSPPTLRG